MRHLCYGADQIMQKLSAERRSDLRHLTHESQAIKSSQQRGLQRSYRTTRSASWPDTGMTVELSAWFLV
jgi:hypothetical protein